MMKKLLFIFAFTLFIFGCEKEITKPESLKEDVPDVYVKNGVLVIKDWNVAYDILEQSNNNGPEYMDVWEEELGFTSMRSTYDNFLQEEEAMVNSLKALYEENPNQVTEAIVNDKYNKLVCSYDHSIIPIELENGEGKYYDMNLHHQIYAPIVNKKGIVCIAGEIYRYTNNDVRKLTKTNWLNLSELLIDNSPLVEIVESNMKNDSFKVVPVPIDDDIDGEDEVDPYDPFDPDNPYACTSRTIINETDYNHCLSNTATVLNKYRLIAYLNFEQHNYRISHSDCSYDIYTKTYVHFKVRSLIRVAYLFGTWQNYTAPLYAQYRIDYSEGGVNKMILSQGWTFGPEWDFLDTDHTYTKTLLDKKTYSDHPKFVHMQLSARISDSDTDLLPMVSVSCWQ